MTLNENGHRVFDGGSAMGFTSFFNISITSLSSVPVPLNGSYYNRAVYLNRDKKAAELQFG